jgi:hypothetical protein
MAKMKKIHYMLENGFSDDRIAWYIFTNGNAGGWHKCKTLAQEMRNDYEIARNDNKEEE